MEAFLSIKTRRVILRDTKGIFSPLVSQVNLNTMERSFEQWSELQDAKCLIVHVLSSKCNVCSFELRKKAKATHQWGFHVANDIILNQVRVYLERVNADNVLSKFWFGRSFSSQHHFKFIANIATEIVSLVISKEFKTRSFIWEVNLNFEFFETLQL